MILICFVSRAIRLSSKSRILNVKARGAFLARSIERKLLLSKLLRISCSQTDSADAIRSDSWHPLKRQHKVHHFTCISGFEFYVCVKL